MKSPILVTFAFLLMLSACAKARGQAAPVAGMVRQAQEVGPGAPRFPGDEWEVAPGLDQRMASPECREFVDFSSRGKDRNTEGVVVIKDGLLQYEYYDPQYGPHQPHILWSVTKTVTGALLGTAVRDGKVRMDDKLSDYYPATAAQAAAPGRPYDQIELQNLFYLDSGLNWAEAYSGDVKDSPVITMLYGDGQYDMAKYAASLPVLATGPGTLWKYSTGTPVITMGVLRKVYGPDYERMPWTNLFDPLGMKSAVFERDKAGNFIGGAEGFLTPRDMARLGYLYLNRGQWNGQTILSEEWIEKTLTPSPGFFAPATFHSGAPDHGTFAGSIWLNRETKPGAGKPYVDSPEDMFLSIGHNGQFVIVLPTQKMVIVRTGYDADYDWIINPLVSRAISCFGDSRYPVGPRPVAPKSPFPGVGDFLKTLESGIHHNIFQTAVATSVCQCHFISGIDAKTCLDRSGVPGASYVTKLKVTDRGVSTAEDEVDGQLSWLAKLIALYGGKNVEVVYDPKLPQFGCTVK